MLIHWIWYASLSGVGDRTKARLLTAFESPEAVFFASESDLHGTGILSEEAVQQILRRDLTQSRKILSQCTNEKISVLTYQDAAYPERLKNIADPPMVLYYRGQLPSVDSEPVVGIVGTRRASPYGLTVAKQMGYQIAECGGIVVSGMAKGIDALAMEGALTAGAPVIGVLGCGVDVIYPASNRALYRDAVRYGCILSEFPPGTQPISRNFPRRNRIISGLSCGVLVIEAPEKSGALITAKMAADQGRDVFAVPSNIGVESAVGSNGLLRDGAIPVFDGADVMEEYRAMFPGRIGVKRQEIPADGDEEELSECPETVPLQVAQKPRKPAKKPAGSDAETKVSIDNGEKQPYIDFTKEEKSMSPAEKSVWDQLAGGKKLTDDVIDGSGLGAQQVLSSLTMLEIRGLIRRLPGRYVERAGKK